jgi:tRNA threonylcarbamoyladenosine biosynthesis protein TsaE
MKEFKTFSAKETAHIGIKLGKGLRPGDVVCLNGELGTGKTAFTGGIAESMGITGYITSPTFSIVNEYNGKIQLYHFDVYRVAHVDEMFEIGFEEYLEGNGVVVIEWAELIKTVLPNECVWVNIKKKLDDGLNTRIIDIEFIGDRYHGYEEKLTKIF